MPEMCYLLKITRRKGCFCARKRLMTWEASGRWSGGQGNGALSWNCRVWGKGGSLLWASCFEKWERMQLYHFTGHERKSLSPLLSAVPWNVCAAPKPLNLFITDSLRPGLGWHFPGQISEAVQWAGTEIIGLIFQKWRRSHWHLHYILRHLRR